MSNEKDARGAGARESSALASPIVCPGCKAELTGETLANELGFGCCKKCQAIFVVPGGVAPAGAEGSYRASFGAPAGLQVVRGGGNEVTAAWRYERGGTPRMVIVAALMLGGVAALLAYSFGNGVKVWPLVVAFPLLLLGGTISYTVLITLVQWQRLQVRSGKLVIGSGPLPMPGSRTELDASTIANVYVRLRLQQAGPSRNGAPPPMFAFYDVRVQAEKMDTPVATLMQPDRALAVVDAVRAALPNASRP